MSRFVRITVELNDGSGRKLSQVVKVPADQDRDHLLSPADQMDRWVAKYALTMTLVDWQRHE